MINEKYKHSELTGKIIGCAIAVHKTLGNGFQEVIYQRALEIEMSLLGIEFKREFEMPIYYREMQLERNLSSGRENLSCLKHYFGYEYKNGKDKVRDRTP